MQYVIINYKHLLIFGCSGSLLLEGLSLAVTSGDYSSLQYTGFSIAVASLVAESRLSVHGLPTLQLTGPAAWAQRLSCMRNLPGQGTEPVSPTLAGGFLSIVPPGKSWCY